jgi:hypothetical protein
MVAAGKMERSCCYIDGWEEVREDFFIDQTVEKMSGDSQTLETYSVAQKSCS